MHSKETVRILSLKYELNQIKSGMILKFCELTPKTPRTTLSTLPRWSSNLICFIRTFTQMVECASGIRWTIAACPQHWWNKCTSAKNLGKFKLFFPVCTHFNKLFHIPQRSSVLWITISAFSTLRAMILLATRRAVRGGHQCRVLRRYYWVWWACWPSQTPSLQPMLTLPRCGEKTDQRSRRKLVYQWGRVWIWTRD